MEANAALLFETGSVKLEYRFLKKDGVIIAANGATLLLVVTVFFVKIRER